ncbi:Penicillin-binding protein activator LpoB [Arsenophonus endosymbiont of Aleurodicus floccissimus]|uniref:penicillin-binding protein activator LpoB n=1 Tax=Arsenophonus endosymbiont of Aleurodicus floccissimus TaxID=2152761 RepID=UPI000E6B2FF4|nr:penicillin-binding protein activator LpoB [Arsenophonus endosymbiont of Aleurodicus floccissimus]SPP31413.1 Penicillin-binding protein activator LpoB [Arsenophonus endosymbiont of Aleurodicus floccissimus]
MRRIFQLMVVTFILVGCSSITNKKPALVITIEPTEPTEQPTTPTSPDTVPQLPKVKTVDWSTVVIPLAHQLVQAQGVESGKVLLIDSIKNNTNMSIQSMQATDAIIEAVNNQNVFKLVPQDVVANTRKALGLSQEDSLVTRSKAIGLARYVQADYVLYSVISGNQQQSEIEMQLMAAQTGEILWSGSNRIE